MTTTHDDDAATTGGLWLVRDMSTYTPYGLWSIRPVWDQDYRCWRRNRGYKGDDQDGLLRRYCADELDPMLPPQLRLPPGGGPLPCEVVIRVPK